MWSKLTHWISLAVLSRYIDIKTSWIPKQRDGTGDLNMWEARDLRDGVFVQIGSVVHMSQATYLIDHDREAQSSWSDYSSKSKYRFLNDNFILWHIKSSDGTLLHFVTDLCLWQKWHCHIPKIPLLERNCSTTPNDPQFHWNSYVGISTFYNTIVCDLQEWCKGILGYVAQYLDHNSQCTQPMYRSKGCRSSDK